MSGARDSTGSLLQGQQIPRGNAKGYDIVPKKPAGDEPIKVKKKLIEMEQVTVYMGSEGNHP